MKSNLIQSLLISALLSFVGLSSTLHAQSQTRGIAILDLSVRNGETNNARLFSAEHMVKLAGINYIVTQDLNEATNYSMLFCSSFLGTATFTSAEKNQLSSFVGNGGILLAPRVEDEELFPLFGISAYESDFTRFEINWDATSIMEAFDWMDEPEEWTISLGDADYDEIYKTLAYTPTTAETLATFEDATSAVTRNAYGDGFAIAIGVSLKEVILRNQINRDYEAQRVGSNGFEPSSDVFSLFVRSLFTQHHPYAVWKHTSPSNSAATLMISHDVDSSTGMDSLEIFVDYESEHNIEATYNVTLRYFEDALMSDFYNNRQSTMDYIKDNGQIIASHSVGHFFDFGDEDIFPIGEMGNTKQNYTPYNDGDITTGGTVFGELEVSKNELESDCNVNVRSFRAGHLVFHNHLVDVLQTLGYEYNSSFSASDVLTSFPYQNKMGRSFSGAVSSVYEFPVTISDVFHDDPISAINYLDKSNKWLEVTLKNRANGAPTVLLIHPNRGYKLAGMSYYLDQLPDDMHIMEMGLFGDYWKAREAVNFESNVADEVLTLSIPSNEVLNNNISFVVNDGQSLASIIVKNEQDEMLNFEQQNWGENDVLVYFNGFINNTDKISTQLTQLSIYPNPAKATLNIEFDILKADKIKMDLFDIHGKRVINLMNKRVEAGPEQLSIDLSNHNINAGIYFVLLQTSDGLLIREKVILMP